MEEYVVQYKDTLSLIAAKRLGSRNRWVEIARLNNLREPYQLFVGQRLKLPSAQSISLSDNSANNGAVEPFPSEQSPASMALARGYMFVVFEQLPDFGPQKVIRKVAVIPKDFSLIAPNPSANISLAEHALGSNQSQFLSASSKPFGAPSIQGKPLLIDLAKMQAMGGKVFTVDEVIADLNRFANQNPTSRTRVNQLIWAVQNVEGETLIQGGVRGDAVRRISAAHTPYISTAEELWAQFQAKKISKPQLEAELAKLETGYSKARIVGRVGRVLTVAGIVFTVSDLADATQRSVERNSYKPLAAESIRQVGGWGGAIAGGKIGFAAGALFGIETGPGAIVTGALGAIIFGALGYFGADFIADWVEEDAVNELRKDVRSTDSMKTKGITLTVLPNETQYDFARRALMQAAFNGGLLIEPRQREFAEKFFPLNKTAEEKARFKINWISGDPNAADGKDLKTGEWENLRGRPFTYFLNDAETSELIKLMLRGY